jgi:hypothetical protein
MDSAFMSASCKDTRVKFYPLSNYFYIHHAEAELNMHVLYNFASTPNSFN